VHKRYQDSTLAAVGAIIVKFNAAHRRTNDKVVDLRPDLKKVSGILVESLSAEWASDPRNSLRTNSWSRVHDPENPELPGAISALGDKLIGHEAAPFPDFR
jgi:hypothetical protein